MNSFEMPESVRLATVEALKNLSANLKALSLDPTFSSNAIKQNTDAIKTSLTKFAGNIRDFSQQECKVIYMAVEQMRDSISSVLDGDMDSGVREVVIEDFRISNEVMRFWRRFLNSSEHGRQVLDILK